MARSIKIVLLRILSVLLPYPFPDLLFFSFKQMSYNQSSYSANQHSAQAKRKKNHATVTGRQEIHHIESPIRDYSLLNLVVFFVISL